MDVEIRGLSKTYSGQVHALRGINLSIPTGIYGLSGPNGAGKTTLMRVVAGIYRPTHGEVHVGPHDLGTTEGRQALKRVLGYLPQDFGAYPDLSATEFLDYVAILKGMGDRDQRRHRIRELLGLSDVGGRKLRGFSGGMRQRVGIAQALLNDPRLLIVDEPTAGLHPEERIRFRNLLVSLAGHGDRTIVLSTHIVEDVAQTSSRVAVLATGEVAFQGETERLLRAADGKVWTLDTLGPAPSGEITVVSGLNIDGGMRYRVVSSGPPAAGARPAEPTLEDGYVALMHTRKPTARVA